MSNDNKTLADAQPGGRVRLGDQAERARFEAWLATQHDQGSEHVTATVSATDDRYQSPVTSSMWSAWQAANAAREGGRINGWRVIDGIRVYSAYAHASILDDQQYVRYEDYLAALSAQPSPGGQRDDSPMAKMAAALRGKAEAERAAFDQRVQSGEWGPMPDNPDVLELPPLPEEVDSVRCMIRGEKAFAEPCDYYFTSKQMRDYARTALAASQPVGATGKNSLTVGGGQEPVAYLDLGEGGYMDVGTDLSDEELAALPKGRHMLGIIGTYGVDGYKPTQAVDLGDFKALYRAYVRLLESGRDRIRDLGGTCDPVDVMEANDVDLQAARRVIDSQAVGK
ncbi:hypothetical protein [Stenotrophomonas sp. SMYL28]|uniref:hypothetical protein n=1 Tax=Stenotrophomonas sp. SMYL28 TaxID=3076049 RepID=UPI002A9439F0|nr:hypothetical protein [Stenotrophomonas sp. SMYL28]HEL4248017.1 hypothetical protein [Stenotrophomonas maltophilia]HEL4251629.1 hypothetical protein [Stenotrophomonas maltophilia]